MDRAPAKKQAAQSIAGTPFAQIRRNLYPDWEKGFSAQSHPKSGRAAPVGLKGRRGAEAISSVFTLGAIKRRRAS